MRPLVFQARQPTQTPRRAAFSRRSAALVTLAVGLVIREAISRALPTYSGARMALSPATSDFRVMREKRRAKPTLSRLTEAAQTRLFGPDREDQRGDAGSHACGGVPAPPWCTDARQAGKMAAWFTSPTTLTWSYCGMLLNSLTPAQIKARSPNCAQTWLIILIVSEGDSIGMLPKPK